MAACPEWIAVVIDVEGAFLQGKFVNGERIYIEVPDGMEEFYGSKEDVALLLNAPIYGTKQAAFCFYKTLVGKVKDSKYVRSKADPCLYFRWKNERLALMVSWVDDILAVGHPDDVKDMEADLNKAFACKSEGRLTEYVGSKVDMTRDENGLGTIKITQPVLVQKLEETFDVKGGRDPKTPALAGQVLVRGDGSDMLESVETTKFSIRYSYLSVHDSMVETWSFQCDKRMRKTDVCTEEASHEGSDTFDQAHCENEKQGAGAQAQ